MRGLLRAVAVVALTAGALAATGQHTPSAWADIQDGTGIHWQYSETANAYWRPPAGNSTPGNDGPSGPPLVWTQYSSTNELLCPEEDPAFACSGDPGAYITGIICGTALRGPRGLPLFAWIRWEREIGPDNQPTPWVGREADCAEPGEDDVVPMQEISNTINAEVFEPVGEPVFQIEPATRTLVNLPTVLSTNYPLGENGVDPDILVSTDPTVVEIPVTIPRPGNPLTGTVTATAGYVWTWQGGNATGRGRPYEAGKDPTANPGYYTTAHFSEKGEQTITLTATWTGTVVVEELAPEEIVPVVVPHSEDIQVSEAEPVITR